MCIIVHKATVLKDTHRASFGKEGEGEIDTEFSGEHKNTHYLRWGPSTGTTSIQSFRLVAFKTASSIESMRSINPKPSVAETGSPFPGSFIMSCFSLESKTKMSP